MGKSHFCINPFFYIVWIVLSPDRRDHSAYGCRRGAYGHGRGVHALLRRTWTWPYTWMRSWYPMVVALTHVDAVLAHMDPAWTHRKLFCRKWAQLFGHGRGKSGKCKHVATLSVCLSCRRHHRLLFCASFCFNSASSVRKTFCSHISYG